MLYRRLAASPAVQAWGEAAFDRYLGQTSHTPAAHVDRVVAAADIRADTRVLELGCGSGGIGCYIATHTGCRLVGIDWSSVAIALASARVAQQRLGSRVVFRNADLRRLQACDRSRHVVFAVDATYFGVTPGDLARVAAASLRPGGLFAGLFSVCTPGATTSALPPPLAGLGTEPELARALGRAGLGNVVSTDLTASYAALVQRMRDVWRADLPRLRRELGPAIATARLDEDAYLAGLLEDGVLRRVLVTARRAHE